LNTAETAQIAALAVFIIDKGFNPARKPGKNRRIRRPIEDWAALRNSQQAAGQRPRRFAPVFGSRAARPEQAL